MSNRNWYVIASLGILLVTAGTAVSTERAWADDDDQLVVNVQDQSVSTQVNTPIGIDLYADVSGGTGTVSFVFGGDPAHGTLIQPDPSGQPAHYVYTPADGYYGSDSFSYQAIATNGVGTQFYSGQASISIQIGAVDAIPPSIQINSSFTDYSPSNPVQDLYFDIDLSFSPDIEGCTLSPIYSGNTSDGTPYAWSSALTMATSSQDSGSPTLALLPGVTHYPSGLHFSGGATFNLGTQQTRLISTTNNHWQPGNYLYQLQLSCPDTRYNAVIAQTLQISVVTGCTDASAMNYSSMAVIDDGSCQYVVSGCTDPNASNYNPASNQNDGSCQYVDPYQLTVSDSNVFVPVSGTLNINLQTSFTNGAAVIDPHFEIQAVPMHGSLIQNSNGVPGSFAYTPEPGYYGQDSFTYVASGHPGDSVYRNSNSGSILIQIGDESVTPPTLSISALADEAMPGEISINLFVSNAPPSDGCSASIVYNFVDPNLQYWNWSTGFRVADADQNGALPLTAGTVQYPNAFLINPQVAVMHQGTLLQIYGPTAGSDGTHPHWTQGYYSISLQLSCPDPRYNVQFYGEVVVQPHSGCTNPSASNYDPYASMDAGNCAQVITGCMDSSATNYNPSATISDASCVYPPPIIGCMDPFADNYSAFVLSDDGSCMYSGPRLFGCTARGALNYNPLANASDHSCIMPRYGCTDPQSFTYDSNATVDDGNCKFVPGSKAGYRYFLAIQRAGNLYGGVANRSGTATLGDSTPPSGPWYFGGAGDGTTGTTGFGSSASVSDFYMNEPQDDPLQPMESKIFPIQGRNESGQSVACDPNNGVGKTLKVPQVTWEQKANLDASWSTKPSDSWRNLSGLIANKQTQDAKSPTESLLNRHLQTVAAQYISFGVEAPGASAPALELKSDQSLYSCYVNAAAAPIPPRERRSTTILEHWSHQLFGSGEPDFYVNNPTGVPLCISSIHADDSLGAPDVTTVHPIYLAPNSSVTVPFGQFAASAPGAAKDVLVSVTDCDPDQPRLLRRVGFGTSSLAEASPDSAPSGSPAPQPRCDSGLNVTLDSCMRPSCGCAYNEHFALVDTSTNQALDPSTAELFGVATHPGGSFYAGGADGSSNSGPLSSSPPQGSSAPGAGGCSDGGSSDPTQTPTLPPGLSVQCVPTVCAGGAVVAKDTGQCVCPLLHAADGGAVTSQWSAVLNACIPSVGSPHECPINSEPNGYNPQQDPPIETYDTDGSKITIAGPSYLEPVCVATDRYTVIKSIRPEIPSTEPDNDPAHATARVPAVAETTNPCQGENIHIDQAVQYEDGTANISNLQNVCKCDDDYTWDPNQKKCVYANCADPENYFFDSHPQLMQCMPRCSPNSTAVLNNPADPKTSTWSCKCDSGFLGMKALGYTSCVTDPGCDPRNEVLVTTDDGLGLRCDRKCVGNLEFTPGPHDGEIDAATGKTKVSGTCGCAVGDVRINETTCVTPVCPIGSYLDLVNEPHICKAKCDDNYEVVPLANGQEACHRTGCQQEGWTDAGNGMCCPGEYPNLASTFVGASDDVTPVDRCFNSSGCKAVLDQAYQRYLDDVAAYEENNSLPNPVLSDYMNNTVATEFCMNAAPQAMFDDWKPVNGMMPGPGDGLGPSNKDGQEESKDAMLAGMHAPGDLDAFSNPLPLPPQYWGTGSAPIIGGALPRPPIDVGLRLEVSVVPLFGITETHTPPPPPLTGDDSTVEHVDPAVEPHGDPQLPTHFVRNQIATGDAQARVDKWQEANQSDPVIHQAWQDMEDAKKALAEIANDKNNYIYNQAYYDRIMTAFSVYMATVRQYIDAVSGSRLDIDGQLVPALSPNQIKWLIGEVNRINSIIQKQLEATFKNRGKISQFQIIVANAFITTEVVILTSGFGLAADGAVGAEAVAAQAGRSALKQVGRVLLGTVGGAVTGSGIGFATTAFKLGIESYLPGHEMSLKDKFSNSASQQRLLDSVWDGAKWGGGLGLAITGGGWAFGARAEYLITSASGYGLSTLGVLNSAPPLISNAVGAFNSYMAGDPNGALTQLIQGGENASDLFVSVFGLYATGKALKHVTAKDVGVDPSRESEFHNPFEDLGRVEDQINQAVQDIGERQGGATPDDPVAAPDPQVQGILDQAGVDKPITQSESAKLAELARQAADIRQQMGEKLAQESSQGGSTGGNVSSGEKVIYSQDLNMPGTRVAPEANPVSPRQAFANALGDPSIEPANVTTAQLLNAANNLPKVTVAADSPLNIQLQSRVRNGDNAKVFLMHLNDGKGGKIPAAVKFDNFDPFMEYNAVKVEAVATKLFGELGIGPKFLGIVEIGGRKGIATEPIAGDSPDAIPMTPSALADVQAAIAKLNEAGVRVEDFQFFVTNTGRALVLDAGGVRFASSSSFEAAAGWDVTAAQDAATILSSQQALLPPVTLDALRAANPDAPHGGSNTFYQRPDAPNLGVLVSQEPPASMAVAQARADESIALANMVKGALEGVPNVETVNILGKQIITGADGVPIDVGILMENLSVRNAKTFDDIAKAGNWDDYDAHAITENAMNAMNRLEEAGIMSNDTTIFNIAVKPNNQIILFDFAKKNVMTFEEWADTQPAGMSDAQLRQAFHLEWNSLRQGLAEQIMHDVSRMQDDYHAGDH